MDPQACYERWVEAMDAGDTTEASYAAEDYNEWRRKGGCAAIGGTGFTVLRIAHDGEVWGESAVES